MTFLEMIAANYCEIGPTRPPFGLVHDNPCCMRSEVRCTSAGALIDNILNNITGDDFPEQNEEIALAVANVLRTMRVSEIEGREKREQEDRERRIRDPKRLP